MELPMGTDQPSIARCRVDQLSDDFMFGFDVENDDDREYLTEIAVRGLGHEDDIKSFIHLGLCRGVEEWEQTISCASAMKDRIPHFYNPLDGRDILTFLSKIYGVEGIGQATDVPLSSQRPSGPCTQKTSNATGVSSDAAIPPGVPVKKQRQAKRERNSPYWTETRGPVRQEDGREGDNSETKVRAEKSFTRRQNPSKVKRLPSPTVPLKQNVDLTITQVRDGPEPIMSSMNARPSINQPGGNETGYTGRVLNSTLPKGANQMTQGSDASESGFETAQIGGRMDTNTADQAPNDDEEKPPTSPKQTPKRKAKSPYFATINTTPRAPKLPKSPSTHKRPPGGTVSSLPIPRLDAPRFGLIQEELATDPFRLLVAVTLLIKTSGKAAIPVFRSLVARYPTARDLADAPEADVIAMIAHLGLGAVRAAKIQAYARAWLADPPRNGVRYMVKGYDSHCVADVTTDITTDITTGTAAAAAAADDDDDSDMAAQTDEEEKGGETAPPFADEDGDGDGDAPATALSSLLPSSSSSAWEIGHLTQGPYALDSWRIFCRDVLRGAATDWKGGGREGEFQPEWMRVLPRDKELRACLRWMWMQEGWLWDPATGDKVLLPEELRRAVQAGQVGYDDTGNLRVLE